MFENCLITLAKLDKLLAISSQLIRYVLRKIDIILITL